jgi:hypothetical protein
VRNLKLKNGLKYKQYSLVDALEDFKKSANYARLEGDNRISIPIYDPNVFVELENLIELSHGYVELQLNPKILTIRIDQFLNLLIQIDANLSGKSAIKIEATYLSAFKRTIELEDSLRASLKSEPILSFKDIQNIFLKSSVEYGVELLLSAIPLAKPTLSLVQSISKAISR